MPVDKSVGPESSNGDGVEMTTVIKEYWDMGYRGYWDGHDLDAIKGTVDRAENNEYVRGWLYGQEEAKESE